MSGISGASSQPLVVTTKKTESVEKKTTLDKGVDVIKAKTAKGTLVGDHYVAVGALGTVGGVAAIAGVAKVADKVPAVGKALSLLGQNAGVIGSGVSLATSVVLAEDAAQSFKEGKSVKGGAEALGAAVTGLGGVELAGRRFNVPVANKALSGTAEFLGKNSAGIIGGVTIAGGAVAIKSGVDDLKEGKKLKGGSKVAGGAVATLGGAELVGRQFGIKYMDQALTGPAKAIFTSKGGIAVSGAAIAATGVGVAVDGVRRLTNNKGVLNDAIGAAEVTAATAAVTGGTSLIGVATKSEKLSQVFVNNADVIGGVALGAGAVALGKHTVKDMKAKGLTVANTATGTATLLAAAGATQVIADKFGVPLAEKALSKGWQPIVATGLGAVSYKTAKNAISEAKDGKAGNAIGQGAIAVVAGASSAAIFGKALNIPGLETMGEKIIDGAGKVAEPVFEFAVKNPGITLGAVAVAGGVGAYAYYNSKKD